MSTIAQHSTPVTPAPVGPPKRWTIAEFDALVRDGHIREGSSTYLWDGEIIEPMAEKPPHLNAVTWLNRLLSARIPDGAWTIYLNAPLELKEGYKPQPDLLILWGPLDDYAARAPVPADVALLIEVADSSYPKDSGPFLRTYAASGIPVYWIVNILERRIEVYTDPVSVAGQTPGYALRASYGLDERVPLFTRHQGVTTEFGDIGVRDILRSSLYPTAKENQP
jgi:Uma2 family endonuclease